ncbi:MAG: recombinase family protein [Polyangiales bacterium]
MNASFKGQTVAVYARFSSDNQKDTSIDDQVRLCTDYVAKHGGAVNPSFVLADHAMSGAVRARPAFERLQRLVERGEIHAIVCESADRLSRDLGDSDRLWKLIAFHNVRLVCASDGIDSLHEPSRMHFRFKAIFADEYLSDLGKKTRRGLLGANKRGTSTGGLPYGYYTAAMPGDDAGERGRQIVIDEEQANVVRRIFTMYRDGKSYLSIAKALNDEGVAPPRATSKKKPSRFWKKGTIREMLRNRAYIGEWSYGKKTWRKDPETRRRCYQMQAPELVEVDDRPHLRLVPEPLWNAVRVRCDAVRENYSGNGEGAAGHRTRHPFSGILFCGVCGHRMADGGGASSRAYRCGAATTGGACSNTKRLRESLVIEAALFALKQVLFETDLRDKLEAKIRARLATFKVKSDDERKRLERDLARVDGEARRLVSFVRTLDPVSNPGAFETIRTSLDEAASEQKAIRAKIEALSASSDEPRLPTEKEILAYVLDIEGRLRSDPTAAREQLRRVLVDGKLTMTPNADGSWQAKSALIIGRIGGETQKPRSGEPSGASGISASSSSEEVEIGRCAGAIPREYTGWKYAVSRVSPKPPDGRRNPRTWKRRAASPPAVEELAPSSDERAR